MTCPWRDSSPSVLCTAFLSKKKIGGVWFSSIPGSGMDRQRGRKSVDNLWDDSLIDIENPRKHRSICLLDCKEEAHIQKSSERSISYGDLQWQVHLCDACNQKTHRGYLVLHLHRMRTGFSGLIPLNELISKK